MEQQALLQRDDEINLVDLFVILIKRKWVLLGVFIPSLLLAFLVANMNGGAVEHHYRTPLEIGAMVLKTDVIPIDTVENLSAKIEQVYVPLLEKQLNEDIHLSVSSPKKSNMVILDSAAGEGMLEKISPQHAKLLTLIQQAEKERFNSPDNGSVSFTRILGPTAVSKVTKDYRSLGVVMTIGAIIGLMLGIFSVFLVEFIGKVRSELRVRFEKE